MNTLINNRQSAIGNRQFAKGFSLTEVLIAVGLLAMGMLFIAGAFPVSIHFTTVATERTIAPIVADEAFAKIKLYGVNLAILNYTNQTQYVLSAAEHSYPSTPTAVPNYKQYWWSAICRRVDINDVQVTVFVSRKAGATTTYPNPIDSSRPVAMDVNVFGVVGYELTIGTDQKKYINDGYTIVDGTSGQIYRVLERYPSNDIVIKLDKSWQGGAPPLKVWVVPPPVNGGRYPCIGVYQKVMHF
jgi:prepilin-type N-terminal cleavage/methylation domain-containing protein